MNKTNDAKPKTGRAIPWSEREPTYNARWQSRYRAEHLDDGHKWRRQISTDHLDFWETDNLDPHLLIDV